MFPPKNCSGCGACVHRCPVQAIRYIRDHEGFYYPSVDKAVCVNCGLCEKICPVLSPKLKRSAVPVAYASQCLREEIRSASSSGGIFSLLAENVIRRGGMVVGCAMTADCYAAEHRVVHEIEDISEIREAKYLQSRADQVYPAIKEALEGGKHVLFSGTPCQVVGLRSYLSGVCEERLITVDLICHGVPSPLVWEKYVKHWEEIKGSKAVSVRFRDKQQGWENYSLVLRFENGDEYRSLSSRDPYCKGFVSDFFLRRSCYSCHAKGESHVSDITLGDFWGMNNVCPSMNDHKGTSLVLLNTKKGEELFHSVRDEALWSEVDFQEAIRHNPSYSRSSEKAAYRYHFMKRIHKKPIFKHLQAYTGMQMRYRIQRKVIAITGKFYSR